MIILDRSGRDLVRRPPPLFRVSRGALAGLGLVAALLVGGPSPAQPAALARPVRQEQPAALPPGADLPIAPVQRAPAGPRPL